MWSLYNCTQEQRSQPLQRDTKAKPLVALYGRNKRILQFPLTVADCTLEAENTQNNKAATLKVAALLVK
jgi:hypothetical protein